MMRGVAMEKGQLGGCSAMRMEMQWHRGGDGNAASPWRMWDICEQGVMTKRASRRWWCINYRDQEIQADGSAMEVQSWTAGGLWCPAAVVLWLQLDWMGRMGMLCTDLGRWRLLW